MPQLLVNSFRYGLDTRRSELTSIAGTLLQLENGHVNQGGEIENRKEFGLVGTFPSGAGSCFGLEIGASTMYTFGSDFNPGGMPTGVTYQRLINPNDSSQNMTGVVWSTSFGGFPFVIAKYADGSVYCFYNGVAVQDFLSGVVTSLYTQGTLERSRNTNVATLSLDFLPTQWLVGHVVCVSGMSGVSYNVATTQITGVDYVADNITYADVAANEGSTVDVGGTVTNLTLLATALTNLINSTTGYTSTQQTGANSNKTDSISVAGTAYVDVETVVSNAGTLSGALINTGLTAVPGVGAAGQFTIQAGTVAAGTNKITAVNVNAVNQLNGGTSVDFTINVGYTANAIANSINANASAIVSASATNGTVFLYEKTIGITPNGYVVAVVAAGNVCIGQFVVGVSVTNGGSFLSVSPVVTANGTAITTAASVGLTVGAGGITVATYVSDIATDINANNATYLACAIGNNLYISKRTTSSSDGPIDIEFTTVSGQGLAQGGTPPLIVSVSPSKVAQDTHGKVGPVTGTGGFTVVSVTGGLPPYSHQWQYVSGNTTSRADSPNSYTTTFAITNILLGAAVWQDLVTDNNGVQAISPNVTIN